jgi:chromate reductase
LRVLAGVHVLAISGSLQRSSANAAVIRAAIASAPPGMTVEPFVRLGDVPLFNADDDAPEVVEALRGAVARADAVLIATPEYGHSVPGVLKNALDWLVRSGELARKPVAAISASPTPTGGLRGLTALVQTLLAQQADVVALLPISGVKQRLDEAGEISDGVTLRRIAETVAALADPTL